MNDPKIEAGSFKDIENLTYKNIKTAGNVRAPPSRKNAPGSTLSVARYTWVYIGA